MRMTLQEQIKLDMLSEMKANREDKTALKNLRYL